MNHALLLHSPVIDRLEASRLLRTARNSGPPQAVEAAEWALGAMPDRIAARRLAIDVLLDSAQFDSADALINAGLMQHPDHASLRLRKARNLHRRGLADKAALVIDRLIADRPKHGPTLELGAEIAAARGMRTKAVALMRRAMVRGARRSSRRIRVVEWLLEEGRINEAADALQAVTPPPALLLARVLRGQRRLLDARECLEKEFLSEDLNGFRMIDLRLEWIEVLDESGDAASLRRAIDDPDNNDPRIMLRCAEAMIGLGDFDRAIDLAEGVAAVHREHAAHAGTITLVASCLRGDTDDARTRMSELAAGPDGLSQAALRRCWRTAILGRIVHTQTSPRQANVDPSVSVLKPMLEHAVVVFEHKAANPTVGHAKRARTIQ